MYIEEPRCFIDGCMLDTSTYRYWTHLANAKNGGGRSTLSKRLSILHLISPFFKPLKISRKAEYEPLNDLEPMESR